MLSFIAAACGGGDDEEGAGGGETTATGGSETAAPKAGGTIRVALIQPTTAPNPLLVQDEGGAGILGATGEFLSFSDENLELQPRIAESWTPNADGSVWTFKIRQGVTFHNGAAADRERRQDHLRQAHQPRRRLGQRPVGARRRPLAGQHRGARRRHRRLQPRRAERQLPDARQLGELQRDHHSRRPRSGRLGQDVRGHRPVQAREASRPRSA